MSMIHTFKYILLLDFKFIGSMINLLFLSNWRDSDLVDGLINWVHMYVCTITIWIGEIWGIYDISLSIQLYLNNILPGAILNNTRR